MQEEYDLLGLSKHSTTQDAKKAYYELALLIHPDRTNSPNKTIACEEMAILTKSYKNVLKDILAKDENIQVTNCINLKEKRLNDLKELDDFVTNMPSFMDIYEETHDDVAKFNNMWTTKKQDELLNVQGYDLYPSEYRTMSTEHLEYNPNIEFNNTELNTMHNKTYPLTHPKELDIVSIDQLMHYESMYVFDYREAHGTPSLLENRIPRDSLEKFLQPPDILSEFDERCALYKNDN